MRLYTVNALGIRKHHASEEARDAWCSGYYAVMRGHRPYIEDMDSEGNITRAGAWIPKWERNNPTIPSL